MPLRKLALVPALTHVSWATLLDKYPPLTVAEEQALWRLLPASAARQRLVEGTLRLAVRVAGSFRSSGVADDLLAEAHLALVRAAVAFDPARGVRFAVFAKMRMRCRLTNVVTRRRAWTTLGSNDLDGRAAQSSESRADDVSAALAELSDRERDVLLSRYGVGRGRETLDEIRARHGVSRERVRQIEAAALKRAAGRS